MKKAERSASELYADDPERADAVVFGRRVGISKRGFVCGAGLAGMSSVLGGPIAFSSLMPAGLIPAALAQTPAPTTGSLPSGPVRLDFPGKDLGLMVLNDIPLAAETPERLLDDETTPTSRFYINNHGQIPPPASE